MPSKPNRSAVAAAWWCQHTQILKELEGLHLSAAEQLEGLYEARLALERERLKQLAAAKDDVELSLKVCSSQPTSDHWFTL
jgi:hypothetical protein